MPQRNSARPPPIILVRTESGSVMPAVKWLGYESYGMNTRLEDRMFSKMKGAAMKEALRIVKHNGGLDISGEYGSIEIEDQEFEPDLKVQDEMNRKYDAITSEGDRRIKEKFKKILSLNLAQKTPSVKNVYCS